MIFVLATQFNVRLGTINQEEALVGVRLKLQLSWHLARPAHVPRHGAGAAAGAVHGDGDGGAERVLTNQRGGLWSRDRLSTNQSSPGPRG